ncbi:hypothetical protein [Bacillus sp. BP-3]|uniref:hypothetical protein n=1 Tax=Bacillus sp. BP-3 TaxID=3022773 RepID=UPI00232DDE2E|nr:hypothetical protein [Bacillus sp. BP-3]MDC2866498.1 hypothetical protein [Bacillus sp. BP-3]
MDGQNIIKCPKCGSNKIQLIKKSHVIGILFLCMSLSTIFIITIPIAFIFFILMIGALFGKVRRARCLECKHIIKKVEEEQYKEFVRQFGI